MLGASKIRLLALAFVLATACKKEEPEYPPQPMQPTPGYPVLQPGAPVTATPATATPNMPAAFGFFCTSDADAQCPYAHCLAGRCGGCTDASQCKANAQCFPTWFGAACLPAQAPAPTAAPPAAPLPAATPTAATPTAAPLPAPAPAAAPSPTPAAAGAVDRARARCVDRINQYRARGGVAPLSAQSDRASCVDAQAQSDSGSRTPHGAFGQCRESAQNECPAWSGTLDDITERCLAMMFAEGPGGGHYVNIMDPKARSVACGVFTTARGDVWMVQDFFR